MGTSVANLHVRTNRADAVTAALEDLECVARVVGPDRGWVSVYEQRASTQDDGWIAELTASLSGRVGAPAVAFLLHDSDLLMAWLSVDGELRTRINTWPGWPDEEPSPEVTDAEPFLELCEPGATTASLLAILSVDEVFADTALAGLAAQLGLNVDAAFGDHRHTARPASPELVLPQFDQVEDRSTPGERALIDAAAAGDLDAMFAALDLGTSPGAAAPWVSDVVAASPHARLLPKVTATPLYAAAANGQVAAVRGLLDRGADPDQAVPQGELPIVAAATAGHPAALQALIDGGATLPHGAVTNVVAAIEMMRSMTTMTDVLPGGEALPGLPDPADLDTCAAILRSAF